MSALRGALRELVGLFVEDVGFTLGIVAAIGLAAAVAPLLDPALRGWPLVAALVVLLTLTGPMGGRRGRR